NGLIWMGTKHFMLDQIQRRLEEGFGTLKMKVGAISWADELALLKGIRERFSSRDLTLRVDANGAFSRSSIDPVLHELAALEVHSIEQPLPTTDRDGLSEVCAVSPIPVALDESLIGMFSKADKELLLDTVRPQYIILKPSFIGGWRGADEWIECAAARGIDWWATSALESTVGMNAIAQWTATKHLHTPQGLGTGSLYTNNIPGPLEVKKGELWTAGDVQTSWSLPESLQTFR
ncbi:o-succinylbenzoate synthase, partial [Schleiferiaceae bacterium]|nr:o-succinylbenzoate synthase [Schleiferiaceae bacterium]